MTSNVIKAYMDTATTLTIGMTEVLSLVSGVIGIAVSLAIYILMQQGRRIEANREETFQVIADLKNEVFRIRGFRHDDRKEISIVADRVTLLEFQNEDVLVELKSIYSMLREHIGMDDERAKAIRVGARLQVAESVKQKESRVSKVDTSQFEDDRD